MNWPPKKELKTEKLSCFYNVLPFIHYQKISSM